MNAKYNTGDLEKRFYAESHSLRKIWHNRALRKAARGKQTESVKGEEQKINISEFEK
jgi:hypothetical protein